MLKEELQAIDVDSLTEEEARVHCMDIVKNAVEKNKLAAKRGGFVAAVLTAASVISTMAGGGYVSYGLWGLSSFFFAEVFQCIANMRLNREHLEKFEGRTYDESYKEFLKLCQNYAPNRVREESKGKAK